MKIREKKGIATYSKNKYLILIGNEYPNWILHLILNFYSLKETVHIIVYKKNNISKILKL